MEYNYYGSARGGHQAANPYWGYAGGWGYEDDMYNGEWWADPFNNNGPFGVLGQGGYVPQEEIPWRIEPGGHVVHPRGSNAFSLQAYNQGGNPWNSWDNWGPLQQQPEFGVLDFSSGSGQYTQYADPRRNFDQDLINGPWADEWMDWWYERQVRGVHE
ncbi:hypothetical protein LTR37_020585 [Vermiconidia calcicola]|uniref:Uncharacterized protein n=1 Tax=Vermiconidia calcicola TaxID=1690605 RepID=A0ACC3MCU5_9PEZI|nr:hypothetical protein LTR37_020585 [Vermiconidia calcicola]